MPAGQAAASGPLAALAMVGAAGRIVKVSAALALGQSFVADFGALVAQSPPDGPPIRALIFDGETAQSPVRLMRRSQSLTRGA